VAEAINMGTYVFNRIGDQITITRILLGAVILAVIGLALVLSRFVTENISRLADAARRVASGDFTARVHIRSKDEMGVKWGSSAALSTPWCRSWRNG
jgi:sigma-B regulation protein RsbU (phosphoserine phosphatase)